MSSPGSKPVIELESISRVYRSGSLEVEALKSIDIVIRQGEMVAIMGPSGSGKSTLMNILGCLDRATSGRYQLAGRDVQTMTDDELARARNEQVGFIFQSYNLLPQLNALRNVELPLLYRGMGPGQRRELATRALERVGLGDRTDHRPNELSGGQQQRVAVARALVGEPGVLLGDEPTGNLDSISELQVIALFQELHQQGNTLVVVTHSQEVARYCGRIIRMRDGQIQGDEIVQEPASAREQLERLGQERGEALELH